MEENGSNGESPQEEITNVLGELIRPARIESVPEFLEFSASIERQEGFGEERIKEIETALREALTNIVKSAGKGGGGEVTVTCKHDHWGKLMIVIEDKGEPFNILLADIVFQGEKNPVDEERMHSARLIKRLIDNLEHKRVDESNILTFTVSPRLRTK